MMTVSASFTSSAEVVLLVSGASDRDIGWLFLTLFGGVVTFWESVKDFHVVLLSHSIEATYI